MLNKDNDKAPVGIAHMLGESTTNSDYWITDSGASDHMTSSLNLFLNPDHIAHSKSASVHLPNGDSTMIIHT